MPPMTGEFGVRAVGVTCAQAAARAGDAATLTRCVSATAQAHVRARSLSVNSLAPRTTRQSERLSVRVRLGYPKGFGDANLSFSWGTGEEVRT
jgi:hypothetical protein